MLIGRCCNCIGERRPTTIKGLDTSDGTTVWEYGHGSFWREHYGTDEITGIEAALSVTKNRFVLVALQNIGAANPYVTRPARTAGALMANCRESIALVKLDATDGTVIETATIDGLFQQDGTDNSFTLITGPDYYSMSIRNAAALSGGDYVILGNRAVAIEWVDYTTDTADKEYILHAHIQQAGKVYIRTKTSLEVIELQYNATAADVEAAFEATADCTAATATGGPWPHRKIEISVTWSAATGDIDGVKVDHQYAVTVGGGGGTSTWDWVLSPPPTGDYWGLNTDACTGGAVATAPATPGSPGDVGIPGTCVGGSAGYTIQRPTYGIAARYDTGTGLITSSVGYQFGLRNGSAPPKLVDNSGTVPTSNFAATAGIDDIRAGANNRVAVLTTNGLYVEGWETTGPWSAVWQKWVNVQNISLSNVEGDKQLIEFTRATFTAGSRCIAQVTIADGTATASDSSVVSTGKTPRVYYHEGSSANWSVANYPATTTGFGGSFQYNLDGSRVYDGTTQLHGVVDYQYPLLTDGDGYYSIINTQGAGVRFTGPSVTPPIISGTNARAYVWRWYTVDWAKPALTTQFRFRFARTGLATKTTAWLDWDATSAEIKTALDNIFTANTGGVTDNVVMYPLGGPASIIGNTDYGLFDVGLVIRFAGFANAAGNAEGYINPNYLLTNSVTIEFQNFSQYCAAGIASHSRTTGTVRWTRTWGSKGATSYTGPGALFKPWLQAGLVIVPGVLVDPE